MFHQIWISKNNLIPEAVNAKTSINRNLIGAKKYKFWTSETIRQLIDQEDSAVRNAFNSLLPLAYKCDLARYLILRKFGGVYLDVLCSLAPDFNFQEMEEPIFFKDAYRPNSSPWDISNAFLYAGGLSDNIFQLCIDRIIANVKNKFYGRDQLQPTGPGVLGLSLAQMSGKKNIKIGKYMPLTLKFKKKNYAFVTPGGTILAFGKEYAGTPKSTVIQNGTDLEQYGKMWKERRVYV